MDDDLTLALLAMERQVWDALVAGDAQADAALLDDGFVGVYSDGFSDKAGHVGQLADGPTVLDYALDQARSLRSGEGHALLSYRATFRRADGREEVMYVSSLWRETADAWVNLFSQDTAAV